MNSANDFGQNQWLVEETYRQWQNDPQSVDPEWQEYFAGNPVTTTGSSTRSSASATGGARADEAARRSADEAKKISVPTAGQQPQQTPGAAASNQASAPANTPLTNLTAAPGTQQPGPGNSPKKPAPARTRPDSPIDKIEPYSGGEETPLKGMFRSIAKNMEASLQLPTATSVRDMPARLMFENRAIINDHLRRTRGGKISFTHIIGWALVKATMLHPSMNVSYTVKDKKPTVVTPEHINLGLAIDIQQKNGARALVVPAIKETENKTFDEFVAAYEDIVARSRTNKLGVDDYAGVTITLTNPGGIGTRHSIPRLSTGGTIVGVGSMDYPAEFQGASADRLADLGVGKLVTITSTYDHRVIQGAESGDFLRTLSRLLIDDEFYDDIFTAMGVPYKPMRWAQDVPNTGVDKNTRVMKLIEAYRSRGHLIADSNPLAWHDPNLEVPDHRDLQIENHGLTIWDLDRTFHVGGFGGKETMTLREVLERLRSAYTLKVGSEFMHIMDTDERNWLIDRIETGMPKPTNAEQKYILQKLNSAEAFENFLQTKYVGQKRFSLEGAESLIPLMDSSIDTAAGQGLDEVVIGMPHRGRLNVLFNIVGKPLAQIFNEFEGNMEQGQIGGSGDVKYHLGATGEHLQMFGDGDIKVSLAANPSHLEAVDPVMEGLARAKQDIIDRGQDGFSVMPLMLHGDASFTGLGIVQETLNLSRLRGYNVGGTVHIVVNNQIGFTTSPGTGRSSYYSTDLAKGYECPIFHVNGDDPESVVWVGRLATEYRRQFGKDVFIDLICYRRRGHNEADDPSMTQPTMYRQIEDRSSVRAQYTEDLIGRGDLSQEDSEAAARDFLDQMESVFNEVKEEIEDAELTPQTGITSSQELTRGLDTNITAEELAEIGDAYANPGEDFEFHKRVKTVAKKRLESTREGGIDWGWAELIAMSSLANSGKLVRLTGEDTRRGTFTQRHAIVFDPRTGQEANPLDDLADSKGNGGKFLVYNSPLTEYAGLGFEYGYSAGNLDALVAWEAQFGDFVNGGQTIIDEYISSGETKWGQLSSVVLLLPHGYEGQGPDHSSARIERFLQLAAEGSMTITQPSSPANYFHLLRRHALGTMKRPLVVFTPKSMLRNKDAVSSVEEFTEVPRFRSVINDSDFIDAFNKPVSGSSPEKVKKILLVSGKLYWEMAKRKHADQRDDLAIVRLEMIHPLPFNRLKEAFDTFPNAEEIVFCQDEPANQGPWPFVSSHLTEALPDLLPLRRVSRRAQSSTATGIAKVHQAEQKKLLDEIFEN